jgi:hypothetical protein
MLDKNSPFERFHRVFGHFIFAGLLVFSIVYAAERTTYIDSAWQFFQRVNGTRFVFESGRYGTFISQLPLVLSAKLHVPLKALVYIFSASYILLYYITWLVSTYRLRSTIAGTVIILSMFMGIRESFMHTVTETQQCLVYSGLLLACLESGFNGRKQLKAIITILVTVLVLFTHPIGVFTAGFAGLFIFSLKKMKEPVALVVLLLAAIGVLWHFFLNADPYDQAQIAQMKSGNADASGNAAFEFIRMHFTHFYWLPELAALLAAGWMTLRREWLKLGITLLSTAAYFAVAFLTFRNGDSSIMLERTFLPGFFMISVSLAWLLSTEVKMRSWIPALVLVFFVVNGIRYINTGCLMYKKRVQYLDELISAGIRQGNDLYFLSPERTRPDLLLAPWALGTETLIRSKMKFGQCISVTTAPDTCSAGNCRLTSMLCYPVNEMNSNYFTLSGKPYTSLK